MKTEYDWGISQLDTKDVNGFTDVVQTVHYNATATSKDGYTARLYGTVSLPEPEEGDKSFVKFTDLSREEVLHWLLVALAEGEETPEDTKKRFKEKIDSKIEAQRNPPTKTKSEKDLPWNK